MKLSFYASLCLCLALSACTQTQVDTAQDVARVGAKIAVQSSPKVREALDKTERVMRQAQAEIDALHTSK